jgi:hypothetical protein
MKAFFGYFVGWPGTWDRLRGKTLLGLVILGGLWLASAAARDYFFMMNPLRGLGDTQPLPMWMEAVSSLFMLLIFEGAHFLGFVGLLCLIAWITGKGGVKEILGLSAWSWIMAVCLNIVLGFAALSMVNWAFLDQPTPAWWPLLEGAARWLLQPAVPFAPWFTQFSPVTCWVMVIFGGFASRVLGIRWFWGILIALLAWLAWVGLKILIYLPYVVFYR